MRGPEAVAAVKARLSSPREVALWLGLSQGPRQAGGLFVGCPVHAERSPSLSLTRGDDGGLRAHCFGCDWRGDVLSLVAVVHGLDVRGDFRQVLALAADRAGVELDDGPAEPYAAREPRPAPAPVLYPPTSEVEALWAACVPAEDDAATLAWCRSRFGDEPWRLERLDLYSLARALPSGSLPSWARCGVPWTMSHRLVVPMFDSTGTLRSLRAIRTDGGAERKRVAPAGYSTAGLVMACLTGRRMLREGQAMRPLDVAILEGEPDHLTRALEVSDADEAPPALIGLTSGAWSAAFAARVPEGSRVAVRTHVDDAGDGYAAAVVESFRDRGRVQVFDLTARQRAARCAS